MNLSHDYQTASNFRMTVCLAVAFMFTALLSGFGHAAEPNVNTEGRKLIDAFVNEVHSLAANFEQTLLDAGGDTIETSTGAVAILKPGRFRWSYTDPYEQLIVADGKFIWSYDVDLEQVTVRPQAEALASTPALLLGGTAEALSGFDIDKSFRFEGVLWVELIPKQTDSGFTRVALGFENDSLSRMRLADRLDQITYIRLSDIATNKTLDPELFDFTPPPGVDVVGEVARADSDAVVDDS